MIAHLCHYAGCSCIAEGYYCKKHAAMQKEKRKRDNALFKGTKRQASGEYNELYHTARWRAMQKAQLRMQPRCAICGARATVADHIVPHRGNLDAFYSVYNLQSLCASCHSKKTMQENRGFRKGADR